MPKVFEYNRFKFFFFSNEGEPRERMHIHVRKAGSQAKIWIEPSVELAENHGFAGNDLRAILSAVHEHRNLIRSVWNGHFN